MFVFFLTIVSSTTLKNAMDLEKIFQNVGSMDAQNVTFLLLGLLAQFGSNKTNVRPSTTFADNNNGQQEMNHTAADDSDVLLAFNLSAILVKYYSNNPVLWNAVLANLEKEEIRRKEEANRRLNPVTSTVLISIYVCLFKQ